MKTIKIRRQMTFAPDSSRVIIRPFIPANAQLVMNIIRRAMELTDEAVDRELELILHDFGARHFDLESLLMEQYRKVVPHMGVDRSLSKQRELLIGALFSGEYALESAALFNPSIVPHPDQLNLPAGALRFVLSLRATGEGHISSIEFRTGIISSAGRISIEPVSPYVTLPAVLPDPSNNYELHFDPRLALSERIIFPVSPHESNGIEDARFVRFVEDGGTVIYYATYTAYNGRRILPQLLTTPDFLNFRTLTLIGNAVQNKGMALFPRRIKGRFCMISRQDDENLYIMFSDNIQQWNDLQILRRPLQAWELVKIGNCGSPIETEAGWLLITHGVGPMRKYCLGALLLDRDDPTKVIGHLVEPLLQPEGHEREGYVPNVVYSCGSLVHGEQLVLTYAMSDIASIIATVNLADILGAMEKTIAPAAG